MLDLNLIREEPEIVREAMVKRQMDPGVVDEVLSLDTKRRDLILQVETMRSERNAVSKEIGRMKDKDSRQAKIDEMRLLGDKIDGVDVELSQVDSELSSIMPCCPISPIRKCRWAWMIRIISSCGLWVRSRNMILNPSRIGTWARTWASLILTVVSGWRVPGFMCSAEKALCSNGR